MTLDLLKRSETSAALTQAQHDANFTAIETEVNAKLDASQKGAVGGVASLDGSGKVPASQLSVDSTQVAAPGTSTNLGAPTATVQGWLSTIDGHFSGNLELLRGLTRAADTVPYFSSVSAMATTALTALGRSVIGASTLSALMGVIGTGTRDGTKFLRDDGSWQAAGSGGGGGSGVGLANPGFTGDGTTSNSATFSGLAAGSYGVAAPATGYLFSTTFAPPTGVHVEFRAGAFPTLADGVVPDMTLGGRVTWSAQNDRQGAVRGGMVGTIGSDLLATGIDSAGTGSAPRTLGNSIVGWTTAGSYGLLRAHPSFSKAAAGAFSSDLAAQSTALAGSSNPAWVFIEAPSGDGNTTTPTSAAIVASRVLNEMFKWLSRGSRVVVFSPVPRLTSALSANVQKRNAAVALFLSRTVTRLGGFYYDLRRLGTLRTGSGTTAGDIAAAFSQNGSALVGDWGAQAWGLDLGQRLLAEVAPGGEFFDELQSSIDGYDATWFPKGSIISGTVANFQGSGGTGGTGISGTIPAGCTIGLTQATGGSGATVVSSIDTDANGVRRWTLTAAEGSNGTVGTANFEARIPWSAPITGTVDMSAQVSLRASSLAFTSSSQFFCYAPNAGFSVVPAALFAATGGVGSFDGRVYVPEFGVTAADSGTLRFQWQLGSGGSGVTRIMQLALPSAFYR